MQTLSMLNSRFFKPYFQPKAVKHGLNQPAKAGLGLKLKLKRTASHG